MLTKHLSNNYQEFTRSTICYSNKDAINYLVLGLISEMAEFVESDDKSEAGDICWYVFRIIDNFGKSFYEVYKNSLRKERRDFSERVKDISSLHKKYIRGDKIDNYPEKMIDLAMQEFFYLQLVFGKDSIPSILLSNKDKLIERQNKGVIKGSGESIEERANVF